MTTKIDDISIFGEYGQAENRLTVALLQILKEGREPLIRHFAETIGFDLPSSDIDVYTQVQSKNRKCTPDGLLQSAFSFSIVVESKIRPNAINQKQRDALLDERSNWGHNVTLLYLTPDKSRPKALLDTVCQWANWSMVRDALQSFLDKPEIENRELLGFLVAQFETFASNLGVLDDWKPDPRRVLVVPARSARGIARDFRVYWCQNRRSFKPFGSIAFYANGEIDTIADVVGAPEDNVILTGHNEFQALADVCPDPELPRRIIRLKNVRTIGPVRNDLRDKNGSPAAWVQNQRYTMIDRIEKARFTSEL